MDVKANVRTQNGKQRKKWLIRPLCYQKAQLVEQKDCKKIGSGGFTVKRTAKVRECIAINQSALRLF